MTCPSCNHSIPSNLLACPDCTTRRAVEFLENYQLQVLPRVYRDEASLVIVGPGRHALLFGDPYRTFCGALPGLDGGGIVWRHHRRCLNYE